MMRMNKRTLCQILGKAEGCSAELATKIKQVIFGYCCVQMTF
jgi:hypothetical protein